MSKWSKALRTILSFLKGEESPLKECFPGYLLPQLIKYEHLTRHTKRNISVLKCPEPLLSNLTSIALLKPAVTFSGHVNSLSKAWLEKGEFVVTFSAWCYAHALSGMLSHITLGDNNPSNPSQFSMPCSTVPHWLGINYVGGIYII